jgi:hypothetical protein
MLEHEKCYGKKEEQRMLGKLIEIMQWTDSTY